MQETLNMWVRASKHEMSAVQFGAEHTAPGTSRRSSCASPPGGESDVEERGSAICFHSPVLEPYWKLIYCKKDGNDAGGWDLFLDTL